MTKPILVTNLPPHCTKADVRTAFSRFGPVWLVVMLEDFAESVRYFLRSAYVFYSARRSLAFFFEGDVDVLIHDYLVAVSPSDSHIPLNPFLFSVFVPA
jgi:RNA recognition motif-containing protein